MQMQCASMTELVMMDETIPSTYSNDSSRNSEWLLSLHQLKIGIGRTHCMCRFLLMKLFMYTGYVLESRIFQ